MNKKYERYIDYIVNDLKPPYFINMKNQYGLSHDECKIAIAKWFGEDVKIKDGDGGKCYVLNQKGEVIYFEGYEGYWQKLKYDEEGNEIYFEDSDGILKLKNN